MTNNEFNSLNYDDYIKTFVIYNSQKDARSKGYEAHHLIPKSIQKKNNDCFDDRCIRVTPFEHILIHYLLAKKYGNEYVSIFFLMVQYNFKKCNNIEQISLKQLQDWAILREFGRISAFKKRKIQNKRKQNICSEETREKIRKANTGYCWWTNDIIEIRSKECPGNFFRRGRLPPSKETVDKIRNALTGKKRGKRSLETRKKLSLVQKGKSKGKYWFTNGKENVLAKECPSGFKPGRVFTDETKEKMSISQTGKIETEETRKRKSIAMKESYKNRTSHNAIQAIDIITKEIFCSVKKGREKLNFKKQDWIKNHSKRNSKYFRLQKLSDYQNNKDFYDNYNTI